MADNPSSSSPSVAAADQIPQNPNSSTLIAPSPSPSLDLPQISSPSPAPSPAPQQPGLQRSGSVPRPGQIQQQLSPSAAAAASAMRHYSAGGQLSFGGPHVRPRQVPLLPSQSTANFNLKQKATGNGMQVVGMSSAVGVNAQMRGGIPFSYAQQQRLNAHLSMRPQQLLPQSSLPSPQKLPSPGLARSSSFASLNPHMHGLASNGQSVLMQSTLAQHHWLKQMHPTMAAAVSPSYPLQQQQQQWQQQPFLPQQLPSSQLNLKSFGLSQQQISQLLQHQSQQATSQQHLYMQQFQQQQSPRVAASQLSVSLSGSQPDSAASGMSNSGGSSRTETGGRLLGKRKIQDLVSQVDSLGRLSPDVEDLLLEIADGFTESVTNFACTLAKHRKSSTLESKDILLHLEKNWHMKIPGYSRDGQKKQDVSVRTLMDSQELEREKSKDTVKQNERNPAVDCPLRPSQSSEHLALPAAASHMMNRIPRF